jgi:hypothetical protein
MPAGVRKTFQSDTTMVAGKVVDADPESSPLDLGYDSQLVGTVELAGQDSFRFDNLPRGSKQIELWLPQFGIFRLRALELSVNATVTPVKDTRPRWISYGSSITQCRAAQLPTQTWPTIVARTLDLNLTCLGFGGECHLDTMVARTVRDILADVVSLCLGINVFGSASLSPRTFRPAIIGLIQTVRERPDFFTIEDASMVQLAFANGAAANLYSSCSTSLGGDVSLTAWGTDLRAEFTSWEHSVKIYLPGDERITIPGEDNIFSLEDRAFVDSVKAGMNTGILATYEDGLKATAIACAASESMETGKVVDLV